MKKKAIFTADLGGLEDIFPTTTNQRLRVFVCHKSYISLCFVVLQTHSEVIKVLPLLGIFRQDYFVVVCRA